MKAQTKFVILKIVVFYLLILQVGPLWGQNVAPRLYDILEDNITSMTNLPVYHKEMKSGDMFIEIVSPSMPLDLEQFSYVHLSGKKLLGDQTAMDKAYILAGWANNICVFSGSSQYIVERLEKYSDTDKLSSNATFSDSFGVVSIIPYPENVCWDSFKAFQSRKDFSYTINVSWGRVDLVRGWLDWSKLRNAKIPEGSSFIVGLLLLKSIHLDLRSPGKITSKLDNEGNSIIGYICVVI